MLLIILLFIVLICLLCIAGYLIYKKRTKKIEIKPEQELTLLTPEQELTLLQESNQNTFLINDNKFIKSQYNFIKTEPLLSWPDIDKYDVIFQTTSKLILSENLNKLSEDKKRIKFSESTQNISFD
jgi:hypothetical protein